MLVYQRVAFFAYQNGRLPRGSRQNLEARSISSFSYWNKPDFRVPKVFDALISGIIPHSSCSWAICTSFGDLPDLNSICNLFHECKLALRPPTFQGVADPHRVKVPQHGKAEPNTNSGDFRHQNGEPQTGDPGWLKVKIQYSSQHISQ
jgi:hypothetical protein